MGKDPLGFVTHCILWLGLPELPSSKSVRVGGLFFRKDWVLWFLHAILGLNILEASLKDFEMGNWLNGLSGFILIVTIPLVKSGKGKRVGWKISQEKPGDLLAYTDAIWNFLYTSWNIAFVYSENPGYAASSLCILLAAELYPVI